MYFALNIQKNWPLRSPRIGPREGAGFDITATLVMPVTQAARTVYPQDQCANEKKTAAIDYTVASFLHL